jgi:hypothetical protein
VSKTLDERRASMQRRKRFRRAGGNDILIMAAVFAGVVGLGIWAFDVPQAPEGGPLAQVAADAVADPPKPDVSATTSGRAPSDMDARAWARAAAADGVLPEGLLQGGELPAGVASSLAAPAGAGYPPQPGSSTPLDPGAAAQLRARLNQAQDQLEAMGHPQSGSIPEDDPAIMEQLPPDIRELYRARLGR